MSKYSEHLINTTAPVTDAFSHLVSKHNAMGIHLRTVLDSGEAHTSLKWATSYKWLLRSSLEALDTLVGGEIPDTLPPVGESNPADGTEER